ncbi:MAG: hypothetical protein ACI8T1_001531 [Verrucomicrobiales bacterium]|jgi:hypothetical protein
MTTRKFLSEPWPGILKRLDLQRTVAFQCRVQFYFKEEQSTVSYHRLTSRYVLVISLAFDPKRFQVNALQKGFLQSCFLG